LIELEDLIREQFRALTRKKHYSLLARFRNSSVAQITASWCALKVWVMLLTIECALKSCWLK